MAMQLLKVSEVRGELRWRRGATRREVWVPVERSAATAARYDYGEGRDVHRAAPRLKQRASQDNAAARTRGTCRPR